MSDLPTRGRCHAVFILIFSARVKVCKNLDLWIQAALDKPTHMAASLDLHTTANLLLDVGLVTIQSQVIVQRDLSKLDTEADLTTLKEIARVLLRKRPPNWLRAVVVDGHFAPEFIPQQDLKAIVWLAEDLEEILVSSNLYVYGIRDDELREMLGNAGESAVMSALRRNGNNPRQVSLVSDHFGYDIEIKNSNGTFGIEVKAAVTNTAMRAFISRNEFDVAKRMADRWKLIQVTFSSGVIARGYAVADDVLEIRELTSSSLVEMAPAEGEIFRWINSAEFRPSQKHWQPSRLVVDDDFTVTLNPDKMPT